MLMPTFKSNKYGHMTVATASTSSCRCFRMLQQLVEEHWHDIKVLVDHQLAPPSWQESWHQASMTPQERVSQAQ